jgi:Na+-driven multidrug efflux pump
VDVLRIHIWASVPVALGLGKEYWLVVKGMGRFSLVSTCAGAASNAALNFWLIPRWGAAGAAVATVISQVLANQVAPWFYRPAREVFWLQWRGLCFWRRS